MRLLTDILNNELDQKIVALIRRLFAALLKAIWKRDSGRLVPLSTTGVQLNR